MVRRLVITGASGFVGAQLVPRLRSRGYELLLVGRDPVSLSRRFPDISSCSYEQIPDRAGRYDALIHLAVLNNNAKASDAEFATANVEFLLRVFKAASAAGVTVLMNITSIHAIDGSRSPYADSKRRALQVLGEDESLSVTNVFLPAVYGDTFSGRLSLVKKAPRLIRPALFTVLTALVPTVHIDRLCFFIDQNLKNIPRQAMLADPQEENAIFRTGKRTIDLFFSLAVISLCGWLMLCVWLLVLTTSRGPGIFSQERVGRNGKPFTCYKFRTMKQGTKQMGTHEVSLASVTALGAFLRRTKIDELPQVWNILRGEMSLVGPRPSLPMQTELIRSRQKCGVLKLRPGITGWAQINGVDMADPARLVQFDQQYIATRGLLNELKIIASTIFGRGHGDNLCS